jgi:PEGA domain
MFLSYFKKGLFAITLSLGFSSCATCFKGSEQPITFSTEPAGADIFIDGVPQGQTPKVISLSTKRSHQVILAKKGYQEEQIPLNRKVKKKNIFLNGGAGVGIGVAVAGAAIIACPLYLCTPFAPLLLIPVAAGCLVGGAGAGVDLATGAGYTLNKNQLDVQLQPSPVSYP